MIRINLLPVRQIQKLRKARRQVTGFVLSILLLLAAIGSVGMHQTRRIDNIQTTINKLNKKKASYKAVIQQIKKLKKQKALLKGKLELIENLKKDSQLPVRLLDEIAAKTPANRLWLKSLVLSSGRLQIAGVALDNATIAQYMKQLRASPYFINADLVSSSLIVVADKKLKAFSLTCRLVSYGRQAPVAKKGKRKGKRKKKK